MVSIQSFNESPQGILNSYLLRDFSIDNYDGSSMPGTFNNGSADKYRTEINVPKGLKKSLCSTFHQDSDAIFDDILASRMLNDTAFANKVSSLIWDTRIYYESLLTSDDPETAALARGFLSEMSKMQVLVGSPILHTPLGVGTHFVHAEVPVGFYQYDWSWVRKLGEMLKQKLSISRAEQLSMPRLTSQGVLLKMSRETPDWRLFSKVIKALIGTRASKQQFNQWLNDMDCLFQSKGFSPLSRHFMQGIRRQQTRKPEPIQASVDIDLGLGGDENVTNDIVDRIISVSTGAQGRVRGIFIPDEAIKARLKAQADGVKHGLFLNSRLFAVDPSVVMEDMQYIRQRTWQKHLVDKEGGLLTFLDASAYDTSQHRGYFDVYYQLLSGIFPDYDDKEGIDLLLGSGIIAPVSPTSDSLICLHEVAGRSTLSGQPDVTTKNNLLHFLTYVQAISSIEDIDPISVGEALLFHRHKDFRIHIHGDDCMRFLGDDIQYYYEVDKIFSQCGIKVGYEDSPSYLKLHVEESADGLCMRGNSGSLLKNRWSEFAVTDESVLAAGLYDTYRKLGKFTAPSQLQLWSFLAEELCPMYPHLLDLSTDEYLKEVGPDILSYAQSSIKKARQVQDLLDRMFYSNGQRDFDGLDLEALYGGFKYDPDKLGYECGLANMSLQDLMALSLELQSSIIDNECEYDPTVYSAIFERYRLTLPSALGSFKTTITEIQNNSILTKSID